MKKIISLIYISVLSLSIFSQGIEIPAYTGSIITKENYTLQYNERYEQADWVAYELTREEVFGTTKRKNSFKTDPQITTGSATLNDYKASGYDRGHLAPSADMKMSPESMSESFYMSNMSPQVPGFNRGIWARLESYVRTWAVDNKSVYVVTGGVLTKDKYSTIGVNNVAVPEYFYKVILDYTGDEIKAIGFILPNEKSSKSLQEYTVTIDEVEAFTGIDFYPLLEDSIEYALESSLDISLWSFKQHRASKTVEGKVKELPKQDSDSAGKYWINSTSMTRHNSSCRYYDNTKKGYFTDNETGKACSICGG